MLRPSFRSWAFRACYYAVSVFFVLTAAALLAIPSRRPVTAWIRLYARVMVQAMRRVGGIDARTHGALPEGPVILAAKHQSWGDGFVTYAAVPDLAFVCGAHLTRIPLAGGILRGLGAIVVRQCGGADARGSLTAGLAEAKRANRSVLIYPEGHLAPVGTKHRYRKGVWHLYAEMGVPVVPVATDLGLRWPQARVRLTPGPASVRFLPAIPPGLGKDAFMARLEDAVETECLAMLDAQRAAGTLPEGWRMPADRRAPAPRIGQAAGAPT